MAMTKWYDNAVMVNRDPNWYGAAAGESAEECRASLTDYLSKYEGAVTDVLIGVLEQTSIIPSKHIMWRGDKVLRKVENGKEVDYTYLSMMRLYRAYAEFGVDGVQIFIDEMKKKGIRPWITLRVNDVHFGGDEAAFLRSDMYYEAKAAGEMVGADYGYYKTAFDFKYPRYREALLNYIGEILDKYDMFGLELDFMREIYCFDYVKDKGIQEIMLDFMRRVKGMAKEAEGRVGHDIKYLFASAAIPTTRTCSALISRRWQTRDLLTSSFPPRISALQTARCRSESGKRFSVRASESSQVSR